MTVPDAQEVEYTKANGQSGLYLVQAPEEIPAEVPILVYMHGMGRDEKQGMTLFPSLRKMLAEKQWIYVSPRDYEFDGLMKDLRDRYGDRPIFLAGASAGARMVFEEARRHPGEYAGLFLIGPALSRRLPRKGEITIPTFLIFGDQDGVNTMTAEAVTRVLKQQKVRVRSIVIKGDGHEAPYGDQSWWSEALSFVTGEDFER